MGKAQKAKPAAKVTAKAAAPAAPKDVLTTASTKSTACRGRWSQCGGKFQQVSESWHICHADTALRETAMKAGFTAPGVRGEKRGSSKVAAPEPKGLSAAGAAKTTRQGAAPKVVAAPEERSHKPPQTVLSQPISRVQGTVAAPALLKTR